MVEHRLAFDVYVVYAAALKASKQYAFRLGPTKVSNFYGIAKK